MAIDEEKKQFAAFVVELMQVVGPAYSKRMFGGHGIFLDGLMFGLIADNTLYLKVDDETRVNYEEHGLQAFTYEKQGATARLSYYEAPEDSLEDLEVMRQWAAAAFEVALRAATKKSSRKKSRSAGADRAARVDRGGN